MGNNRVIFNTEVTELKISNRILIIDIRKLSSTFREYMKRKRNTSVIPQPQLCITALLIPFCLLQGGEQPYGGWGGWGNGDGEHYPTSILITPAYSVSCFRRQKSLTETPRCFQSCTKDLKLPVLLWLNIKLLNKTWYEKILIFFVFSNYFCVDKNREIVLFSSSSYLQQIQKRGQPWQMKYLISSLKDYPVIVVTPEGAAGWV